MRDTLPLLCREDPSGTAANEMSRGADEIEVPEGFTSAAQEVSTGCRGSRTEHGSRGNCGGGCNVDDNRVCYLCLLLTTEMVSALR